MDTFTLSGKYVTLEPLDLRHTDGLIQAVQDGELWKNIYTPVPSPEKMQSNIEEKLEKQKQGSMLPFAVISNHHQQPIGMTSYYKIDSDNKRCSIGYTWYSQSYQKTGVNTECKLLLLEHIFEKLNYIAVTFNINANNMNSRLAVERIGAKLDGVLRNFFLRKDGTIYDCYHYSIIHTEWPDIKSSLQKKLK